MKLVSTQWKGELGSRLNCHHYKFLHLPFVGYQIQKLMIFYIKEGGVGGGGGAEKGEQ